jgi:hypothetical protein
MWWKPAASNRPSWVPVARWLARILAVLAVGMILAFLLGEGVDAARLTPVAWLTMAAFAALCASMLLGWRRDVAGHAARRPDSGHRGSTRGA